MPPGAPDPRKPPFQLQTTHGRWSTFGGLALVAVIASVLLVWPQLFDRDGNAGVKRLIVAFVAVWLSGGLILYLRTSGLFVDDRGRITSRRFLFDRGMVTGEAITGMSMRPWYGVMRLSISQGDQEGVPSVLHLGPFLPQHLRTHPNRLLVRPLPVRRLRRGHWVDTGIVWSDYDAFLNELTAYLDAARGIEPAVAEAELSAAEARTASRTAAHASRLDAEAAQPLFRTSHSLDRGQALPISVLGHLIVVLALVSAVVAFVADLDFGVGFDAGVPLALAILGAAIAVAGKGQPQVTGVLVKHGRLVTGTNFVLTRQLRIVQTGRTITLGAVSSTGKTHAFSELSHRLDRTEPNELLVRYPKSPRTSEQRWRGTGVFWASDGTAVINHIECALCDDGPADDDASRAPGSPTDLRDAA